LTIFWLSAQLILGAGRALERVSLIAVTPPFVLHVTKLSAKRHGFLTVSLFIPP